MKTRDGIPNVEILTPREKEILIHHIQGSLDEIKKKYGYVEHTLFWYLKNIYRKLLLSNKTKDD